MKDIANSYDIVIAGGGLAGLSLSIQLARAGYAVAVFEKDRYPSHKVCGEYISLESWNFLEELGLPLSDWNLPLIRQVLISAPDGTFISSDLPLGGFGISRFKLDSSLAEIAQNAGVTLHESTRVDDISFARDRSLIRTQAGQYQARVACGTFGKRSNLDVRWKRPFIDRKSPALNNLIGLKYHVRVNPGKESFFPPDRIVLHNFRNGYCGMSKIEGDLYCLCYLTRADNLRGRSIPEMEQNILTQNPFLDQVFSSIEKVFTQPLTISQISFDTKSQVEEHVLLIGDAAGMVTPLSGNGMSMAFHGSKIAFQCIDAFLKGQMARYEMEQEYTDLWRRQFNNRLRMGRFLQLWFGSTYRTNLLLHSLKPFPKLISLLIRQTHGQPF